MPDDAHPSENSPNSSDSEEIQIVSMKILAPPKEGSASSAEESPSPPIRLPDPPAEWSRSPAAGARRNRNQSWSTFMWLAFPFCILAAARFMVPPLVEEIRYSLARGQQRAEYETATGRLKDTPLAELSSAYQLVSQRVGPSVVHIRTVSADGEEKNDILKFLNPDGPLHIGQGSGVIVDNGGYILTNLHVVRGSKEIRVRLSDGRDVPADIVGEDSLTDLTVLKIDADKLIAAEWGPSDDLHVGALVWAVGSPFGLERSITFGILSAKNRAGFAGSVQQDFLQTDAAVNPGNSGGPLVDAQGRIIGINTAIVGQTYRGISFAIPSEIARDVFERLRENGRVRRGWLGVGLAEVTSADVKRLGLPNKKGARIGSVVDESDAPSPAFQAGLKRDDVVIRWNGRKVTGPAMLSRMVAATEIGSTVTVVVIREGAEMNFEVEIDERPGKYNTIRR